MSESFSMSVQQAERAWEACGYEVRFTSRPLAGNVSMHQTRFRVELEHPSHRGNFTAGEGHSDLEAMADASRWELKRMEPLQRQLWYEAAEDQGGRWK